MWAGLKGERDKQDQEREEFKAMGGIASGPVPAEVFDKLKQGNGADRAPPGHPLPHIPHAGEGLAMNLSIAFLIAALVLFVLAAAQWPATSRVNLLGAGLACWVAAQLVGHL